MLHTLDTLNWRDLQIALALFTHGDVTRAAHALHLSESTLHRRIQALEAWLEQPLFERGAQPTELGERLLAQAAQMRALAGEFVQGALEREGDVAGQVSLTLPESLIEPLVSRLPTLYAQHPELEVRLVEARALMNLSEGEVDLALRVTREPQGALWGRKLGPIRFAVHGLKSQADTWRALPPQQRPFLTLDTSQERSPQALWEQANLKPEQIRLRTSSRRALVAAARAGLGLVILPLLDAARYEELEQLGPELDALELELWILAHETRRHLPRLRAVMEFVRLASEEYLEDLSRREQQATDWLTWTR